MIDLFPLQIASAFLFVLSLLAIYQVNFRGSGKSDFLNVKAEIPESVPVQAIGALVTIVIPMTAVILLLLNPTMVYGTILNISFYGDIGIQILGMVLHLVGAGLLVWSNTTLGKYDTGRIAVAEDHAVVDTGPYARVRHPGYSATFMLNLSVFLVLLNVLLIPSLLAAAGYIFHRAKLEENLLSSDENIGKHYRDYMTKTGRFFPKLR